ncbi:MAG: YebC/PmpR family DNA-binding transcriptional regulator [Candidatus Sungbacteria bacterium]|uniref:Probable transcriptional regulatory protein HY220_01385 n=1 Tax=Candidatus Sungiibacteriota bacterium TaxID=2750080 RepID=A0A9D6LN40_9BACT|nr:YebC/PmpR family DNA-binding transcriptional regulator [Candidatus Sungbacteria bacterium]
MSGHSKWAQIKHKKAVVDAKRSNLFSKLVRAIMIAARTGENPDMNPRLKLEIDRAREFNMPAENIERAIKKATSAKEADLLSEVLYEAYGPGGVAILIEGVTDNKNRTAAEIKRILADHGGKLAEAGSVQWLFERKAILIADAFHSDEIELGLIDAGAEDISHEADATLILSPFEIKEILAYKLRELDISLREMKAVYLPKNKVARGLEADRLASLVEALETHDDVLSVWTNTAED